MKTGWEVKSLGEVCELKSGTTIPTSLERNVGDVLYTKIADMNLPENTVEIHTSSRFVNSNEIKQNQIIPEGAIIFPKRGGAIATNKKRKIIKPTIVDLNTMALIPSNKINKDYLFHWFQLFDLNSISNGANIPQINNYSFDNVYLTYPTSLPEQQRIVAILDAAFASIATAKANTEQNLKNARALFDSYLQSIDANFENVSLGDLVNIKTGKLDVNAAVENGEYPFFTCSRDIYAIDKYAFDCEAILLAGNNAVGDFNIKHYKGKFNAYQRTYVITVNEKNALLYRFLYFQLLKSLKLFKEQSVGAATKFLKLGMIKDLKIALPTISEQEKIVLTTDSLLKETQCLETIYQRKLAALDELKKALLHQAFSGEL